MLHTRIEQRYQSRPQGEQPVSRLLQQSQQRVFIVEVEALDVDRHPFLDEGDLVILAAALPFNSKCDTNMMKLHRIGGGSKLLSKA